MTATSAGVTTAPARKRRPLMLLPALAVTAVGLAGATLGHRLVPQVGLLTWAVALGVLAANLNLIPRGSRSGLAHLTRKLLRVGVILLGFSISLHAVAALGPRVLALVAGVLGATLAFTYWLGSRMRLGGPRSLLIATGVAICGASAIAAMEETAGGDEEDATAAIAMITLWGTASMIALPLLQRGLVLSGTQFGVWAGASVHEVGQVVATASPVGTAALTVAVVVKLTRVLLLAPVVATVSTVRRWTSPRPDQGQRRPPLVPLFVLGFLACAGLRSSGVVPAPVIGWIGTLQATSLGAALFGMGVSVHLASLVKRSAKLLAVAAIATLFISATALAADLLLVHA
ncbi:MAG TPA: putative sulfate exporter family transporter [Rugosimonospora sp.]|nr:putative sulfate exporter family transporter [Rugosimonospora sp.]